VWRNQHVPSIKESAGCHRFRLTLNDVKAGRGHNPSVERSLERPEVDQWAAARIHDHDTRAHPAECDVVQ